MRVSGKLPACVHLARWTLVIVLDVFEETLRSNGGCDLKTCGGFRRYDGDDSGGVFSEQSVEQMCVC